MNAFIFARVQNRIGHLYIVPCPSILLLFVDCIKHIFFCFSVPQHTSVQLDNVRCVVKIYALPLNLSKNKITFLCRVTVQAPALCTAKQTENSLRIYYCVTFVIGRLKKSF